MVELAKLLGVKIGQVFTVENANMEQSEYYFKFTRIGYLFKYKVSNTWNIGHDELNIIDILNNKLYVKKDLDYEEARSEVEGKVRNVFLDGKENMVLEALAKKYDCHISDIIQTMFAYAYENLNIEKEVTKK